MIFLSSIFHLISSTWVPTSPYFRVCFCYLPQWQDCPWASLRHFAAASALICVQCIHEPAPLADKLMDAHSRQAFFSGNFFWALFYYWCDHWPDYTGNQKQFDAWARTVLLNGVATWERYPWNLNQNTEWTFFKAILTYWQIIQYSQTLTFI